VSSWINSLYVGAPGEFTLVVSAKVLTQMLAFGLVESAATDKGSAAEREADATHPTAKALVAARFDRLAAGTVHSTPVC
jgi:hypothetical protein